MELNSFCVIVTKDGLRVYWKRPEKINDAIKTYNRLSRLYSSSAFPVLLEFDYTEVIQENLNNIGSPYSDEWIEERIRMWQGNTELIFNMVVNLSWSLDDGKGTQIELLHSSRA